MEQVSARYGIVDKIPRIRERSIAQVTDILKRWARISRDLTNIGGTDLVVLPSQVSNLTGMNRRSLNDYLRLIRLGEVNGFDFEANKDKGIGLLRQFVKALPKRQKLKLHRSRQQKVHLCAPKSLLD